jgi:hypothetical protein
VVPTMIAANAYASSGKAKRVFGEVSSTFIKSDASAPRYSTLSA